MGLFGTKTKKSSQSDSSSIRKHTVQASTASATKHNPEASDIVGASPSFNPSSTRPDPRRQGSVASENASLKSRPSANMLKLFGGSTSKRRSSRGPSDSHSPRITQPTEYFGGRTSTSQNRTPTANLAISESVKKAPSPAVETPLADEPAALGSLPMIGTPTGDGSLVNAVNKDVPGAGLNPTGAPRPSELFAGKGVQWNEIDLTARDAGAAAQPAKAEDLQSFLKARRQWIPTFKTEDTVTEENHLPVDRLENLSFNTPAVDRTNGLMSLKDLEESHKRKAALSSKLPIVSGTSGAIFDEAGEGRASTSADLPPRPTAPARNQSFRTSNFAAGGSSSGVGSGSGAGASSTNGAQLSNSGVGSLSRKPVPRSTENDEAAAASQRNIPQRRSSMQRGPSSSGVNGNDENGGDPSATPGEAVAASPSIGTTTGFATPETSEGAFQNGAADSTAAPPRPPKADRTPSASRKNSQDPLHTVEHVGVANGHGASRAADAAALPAVEEVATTRAAPALTNEVPGTGAIASSSSAK